MKPVAQPRFFFFGIKPSLCCRSFASVCNLQEVENRGGVARMIQALTEVLVQPLDSTEPPDSETQLEFLLLMEEGEGGNRKEEGEK